MAHFWLSSRHASIGQWKIAELYLEWEQLINKLFLEGSQDGKPLCPQISSFWMWPMWPVEWSIKMVCYYSKQWQDIDEGSEVTTVDMTWPRRLLLEWVQYAYTNVLQLVQAVDELHHYLCPCASRILQIDVQTTCHDQFVVKCIKCFPGEWSTCLRNQVCTPVCCRLTRQSFHDTNSPSFSMFYLSYYNNFSKCLSDKLFWNIQVTNNN